MAFRFSLQTVLQFRHSIEHQEELRLRAIHQALRKIRHQVEQIAANIRSQDEVWRKEMPVGVTGAEIRFSIAAQGALMEQRERYRRDLIRLEKVCEQQQAVFSHARRQRETLESLRDHLLYDYERESLRREQQRMDEVFLIRRTNKQGG